MAGPSRCSRPHCVFTRPLAYGGIFAARPRRWTYPQTAYTALVSHDKPHWNVSTEFHTRSGPCTLVPLRPLEGRPNRSSLVWLMSPDESERRRALAQSSLAQEIEDQTCSL